MARLTTTEKAAYDEEGWVIPSFRLPEERVNALVAELDRDEGVSMASFDLDAIRKARAAWGIFRDRRPERYGVISGQ